MEDIPAEVANGTVTLDIRGLLYSARECFVWNGRKYLLSPENYGEFGDLLEMSDGTFAVLDTVWSQDVTGGEMVLELIIVIEVVPEGGQKVSGSPNNKMDMIRTVATIGRMTPEKSKTFQLLELPEWLSDILDGALLDQTKLDEHATNALKSLKYDDPTDGGLTVSDHGPMKKKRKAREDGVDHAEQSGSPKRQKQDE